METTRRLFNLIYFGILNINDFIAESGFKLVLFLKVSAITYLSVTDQKG